MQTSLRVQMQDVSNVARELMSRLDAVSGAGQPTLTRLEGFCPGVRVTGVRELGLLEWCQDALRLQSVQCDLRSERGPRGFPRVPWICFCENGRACCRQQTRCDLIFLAAKL